MLKYNEAAANAMCSFSKVIAWKASRSVTPQYLWNHTYKPNICSDIRRKPLPPLLLSNSSHFSNYASVFHKGPSLLHPEHSSPKQPTSASTNGRLDLVNWMSVGMGETCLAALLIPTSRVFLLLLYRQWICS